MNYVHVYLFRFVVQDSCVCPRRRRRQPRCSSVSQHRSIPFKWNPIHYHLSISGKCIQLGLQLTLRHDDKCGCLRVLEQSPKIVRDVTSIVPFGYTPYSRLENLSVVSYAYRPCIGGKRHAQVHFTCGKGLAGWVGGCMDGTAPISLPTTTSLHSVTHDYGR